MKQHKFKKIDMKLKIKTGNMTLASNYQISLLAA